MQPEALPPISKVNHLGFLRLLFASMVIVAHSFALTGDPTSDPLQRFVGTITSGSFAVDGFFLISGYLITDSFLRSPSIYNYLFKRVIRIYPGYVVAALVAILCGATTVAALPTLPLSVYLLGETLNLTVLGIPQLPGAYAGLKYPALNGSMWTIGYEFLCYLMVIAFGVAGMFARRRLYLLVVIAAMAATIYTTVAPWPISKLFNGTRLAMLFLTGGAFYLWRDKIRYHGGLAFAGLFVGIFIVLFKPIADVTVAILGGYAMFWFAFRKPIDRLARIGTRTDISYGVYLYAWPIQNLIIWHFRDISPWRLWAIALPLSMVAGWFSWTLVEKPFLRLKRRRVPEV